MSTKTTAKAKATKEVKETKEFKLESIFSMWRNVSKQGKVYFSGQFDGKKIRGFYNTDKKNPKEPDFRVYALDEKGDIEKDEIVSLWCNVSKKNKRYLSGKIDGQKLRKKQRRKSLRRSQLMMQRLFPFNKERKNNVIKK